MRSTMTFDEIFSLTKHDTIIDRGIYVFFDTIMDLTFTYIIRSTTKATSYQRAHDQNSWIGY